MIEKSRGIVLHVIDYSEASIIAKVYTETKGLQSFLVNGVRKEKARYAHNLFQPLSLIEVVAYFKKPGGLHRISDVSASPQLHHLPYDTAKTTMAIFLAEILYRSIKEEETNPELFKFIDHAVQILDLQTETTNLFHLNFMLQLSRYLGFYPSGRYSKETPFFDLQEGTFQETKPMHPYYLNSVLSEKFDMLLAYSLEDSGNIRFSSVERKQLLDALVGYYELHHTQGMRIRSHEILAEVLG
jgi:DNA repair protein RecO (recombination protein O)